MKLNHYDMKDQWRPQNEVKETKFVVHKFSYIDQLQLHHFMYVLIHAKIL